MTKKIIVVAAAHGNDHVKSLGGQAAVLLLIIDASADGAEIRRELCSAEKFNTLPSLAVITERHGLLVYCFAPQALFTDNGEFDPELPALLTGAQTPNAPWLKLSLGHFPHNQQSGGLREILRDSGMALVIENDQTDCGQLTPMQRFRAACRVHQLPVIPTSDMGNWLWIGDLPEETACRLAPTVSYIHVKMTEPYHEKFRAVPPDQTADRQLVLLDNFPADAPRGVGFPLAGHDLTAVIRRYVNLLRKG